MKFDHRFVLTGSEASMRSYAADGVTMRLDFFENMLRVALLREGLARAFPGRNLRVDRDGAGYKIHGDLSLA